MFISERQIEFMNFQEYLFQPARREESKGFAVSVIQMTLENSKKIYLQLSQQLLLVIYEHSNLFSSCAKSTRLLKTRPAKARANRLSRKVVRHIERGKEHIIFSLEMMCYFSARPSFEKSADSKFAFFVLISKLLEREQF